MVIPLYSQPVVFDEIVAYDWSGLPYRRMQLQHALT